MKTCNLNPAISQSIFQVSTEFRGAGQAIPKVPSALPQVTVLPRFFRLPLNCRHDDLRLAVPGAAPRSIVSAPYGSCGGGTGELSTSRPDICQIVAVGGAGRGLVLHSG